MLDFILRTPYTGPSFRPARADFQVSWSVGRDRSRPAASYVRHQRMRAPGDSPRHTRIGGQGYADRNYRTAPHRQGIRVHPR
jgi:hypothetical protein